MVTTLRAACELKRKLRTALFAAVLLSYAVVPASVFGQEHPPAATSPTEHAEPQAHGEAHDASIGGMLKGMAHAGAAGDEGAFIFSLHLRPTQLRIGRKIAISPDREAGRAAGPEIATVGGEQIVIEPYRGKVRSS